MNVLRSVAAAIACFFVAACAAHGPAPKPSLTPSASPVATPLIDARGVTMPLRKAVREIAFRPFLPSAQIVAVAAIPPLGGADRRESHGLAIEYDRDGDALLLSQWPRGNFDIGVAGIDASHRPCAPVAYTADALLWTTRNGLVMTLQPDGIVAAARVAREAHRLLSAGACTAG